MKFHDVRPPNPHELSELKKLVSQGEGLTLEFKKKASHPDKIVREMIAFANTRGGVLLVGVGDDKSIAGVKFPEDESHVIQQALQKCKPKLIVYERWIPVGLSKTVLLYELSESKHKPHYWQLGGERTAFVRVADQSIKASKEVTEIYRRAHNKKGVQFYFGEHERTLMQYLDANKTITLKRFCDVTGIRKYDASKKLVLLVLAGVLHIAPNERGDVYSLAYKEPSIKKNYFS